MIRFSRFSKQFVFVSALLATSAASADTIALDAQCRSFVEVPGSGFTYFNSYPAIKTISLPLSDEPTNEGILYAVQDYEVGGFSSLTTAFANISVIRRGSALYLRLIRLSAHDVTNIGSSYVSIPGEKIVRGSTREITMEGTYGTYPYGVECDFFNFRRVR